MQEQAVIVVEALRDEVGKLTLAWNPSDQPALILFQTELEQTGILEGFAVEVQTSADRRVDCRLNVCRYHFLEVLVERLLDVHGGSIPWVAWNQKIGLVDWVVVLEIEIWNRIGCLETVVKYCGVGEIRIYHLLERWDLVLVEIRCDHIWHLSPRLAPFLD
jgi:hypothetical protein